MQRISGILRPPARSSRLHRVGSQVAVGWVSRTRHGARVMNWTERLVFPPLSLPTMAAGLLLLAAAPEVRAQSSCQLQKVLASDGATASEFGVASDISGDAAVVASWQHGKLGPGAGAAYVFERLGASWVETALLLASDGAPGDLFGTSVKISGDVVVVAALRDDDNGEDSGSAYIYEKVAGRWTETAKLLASDGEAHDQFGFFVGVSGTTALVTARFDEDNGNKSGSAYIYEKVAGRWVETQKLVPSDGAAGDQFGYGCSLWGTTAVISSVFDDDRGQDSGSVYVFEKIGSSWVETRKLLANDGSAGDAFGISVSIDGSRIVVGAMNDDPRGTDSGSAYVFEKQGSAWLQTRKLVPSDGAAGDHFGVGVSVSGARAVVGSHQDDDRGADSGLGLTSSGTWGHRGRRPASCLPAMARRTMTSASKLRSATVPFWSARESTTISVTRQAVRTSTRPRPAVARLCTRT